MKRSEYKGEGPPKRPRSGSDSSNGGSGNSGEGARGFGDRNPNPGGSDRGSDHSGRERGERDRRSRGDRDPNGRGSIEIKEEPRDRGEFSGRGEGHYRDPNNGRGSLDGKDEHRDRGEFSDRGEHSFGRGEHSSRGAHGGRGERSDRGEHSRFGHDRGKGEFSGRGEYSGRGEFRGHGEHSERGEFSGRGEHSGRGEISRRGEHSGRGELSGSGEHSGSSGRGEHSGSIGRGEHSGGGDNVGSERGRARGRGGDVEGRRGARREERLERHDLVISRTVDLSKRGVSGRRVDLMANFFILEKRTDWCIFNYRVDFKPDEERTHVKKQLLKAHTSSIGAYIFDGSSLYVSHRLSPDPMVLHSIRDPDNEKIELTVRLVAQLTPTDVMYLQFYNIIVRKCLSSMDLEELGRHFYDRHQAIRIEAHHLELWPGYKTTMRNHEQNVLLGVEVTHKVLRLDNCLQVMTGLRNHQDCKRAIMNELVGTIIMTHYNRKTYRVDDIDWDTTPNSTFELKGEKVSFAEYFRTKYKIEIRDMDQPMLVSRPKKRDFHRGMTGPILLVPEMCQMTGLTDAMRGNFQLMKALTNHLHVGPGERVEAVHQFMVRLKRGREIQEELDRWGLKFKDSLVHMQGRVLPKEEILFADTKECPDDKADWTKSFRNVKMLSSVPLQNWIIIVPSRDAQMVDNVIRSMMTVSRPLNFQIRQPCDIMRIPDIRVQTYIQAINQGMANFKGSLQLIFVVLPNNKVDTYSAVKKRCCIDFGVPSQCFVAKNGTGRSVMSVCTKVVIQINAKLGGEPWSVSIPLKNLMIVGFDVYHCGKRKGASVGAMVATTNSFASKYYSTVSFHTNKEELSANLCTDITKCLHAYKLVNDVLPDRIIMYRDGVGEGQLTFVFNTELEQIKNALTAVYTSGGRSFPKFSFLVVTKKINTRIFYNNPHSRRPDNPEPGTIVDDVITLPERYDFYLIAQAVRQGTVSPTSYNVLFDRQGLDADKVQRLTYKLTHMYYNWSGTVAVPAPCQYAHKLAYLTGMALGDSSHERLSHLLHYL